MRRAKILLIDDDEDIRAYICGMLADHYDVVARDHALAGIFAAHDLKPDLLLIDLSMPNVGGWDVVATLRSEPENASTPMIIITASDEPELEERARGLDCLLVRKPLQLPLLLGAIEGCLGH